MQQKLINITDVVSSEMSKAEEETMALLPAEFVPGKWDVICQRGKECYDHGKFSQFISFFVKSNTNDISQLITFYSG